MGVFRGRAWTCGIFRRKIQRFPYILDASFFYRIGLNEFLDFRTRWKKSPSKSFRRASRLNSITLYWIVTFTLCSQSLIGAKILRRPLSYLASAFSVTTSWANMKQPEYSVSSPLGADTQKLSFLISSEMAFLSTPGYSSSILMRSSLSS